VRLVVTKDGHGRYDCPFAHFFSPTDLFPPSIPSIMLPPETPVD
jgi:hypothetical protein